MKKILKIITLGSAIALSGTAIALSSVAISKSSNNSQVLETTENKNKKWNIGIELFDYIRQKLAEYNPVYNTWETLNNYVEGTDYRLLEIDFLPTGEKYLKRIEITYRTYMDGIEVNQRVEIEWKLSTDKKFLGYIEDKKRNLPNFPMIFLN